MPVLVTMLSMLMKSIVMRRMIKMWSLFKTVQLMVTRTKTV